MAENTRPKTQGKKKFKLTDAILSVICVVFVAEAAAPVAAIGNSQYFWWIFLMLTFLLPYGLLSASLSFTAFLCFLFINSSTLSLLICFPCSRISTDA